MQLGKLQEQWTQLTLFFNKISNLIKINMEIIINTFIKYTDNQREAHSDGYTMSQGIMDIIYKTTLDAVKYSYLVNYISSGYFQVFHKCLMNSISLLGNLLSLESRREIEALQRNLTNNCQKTVREREKDLNKKPCRSI